MKVKVLHTGSKGNCTVIDDALIIDAGWSATPEGVAVFLTHHHTDHTAYLDKMFGLPIYATKVTIENLKLKIKFAYTAFSPIDVDNVTLIHVGDVTYNVQAFKVNHDVPCVGFDIVKSRSFQQESRIFYATDFNTLKDEDCFITNLRNKVYDAIYIEANNSLSPTDFLDIYFTEENKKEPSDTFHRVRSFNTHSNVDYLISLFTRAGYSEKNKFTEPVTLLHKSSYYYSYNPERVVDLCKMVKITNPLY